MYVSGLIETGKQFVSAVPRDAIVKANDKSYIFVFEGIEKELIRNDPDDKEAVKNEFQGKYRFKMIEVVMHFYLIYPVRKAEPIHFCGE